MKLTGRNGTLRIYDSAAVLHGTAPLDNLTPDVVTFDGGVTYANITSNVTTDDTNYANNFLADNDDVVYIGSTSRFAMIRFLKDGASDYAAGSGALKIFYYDGTDFATAITSFTDGTASGGDCFAQDGYIGFKIPSDWATGANAYSAELDSNKYYVALMTTTSSTTDPDADILCPVDGQYFEVAFSAMDFSGPLARAKTEEILVLNRDTSDSYAHYIEGGDTKIYDPLQITFSALLDDTVNKDDLLEAYECGNPSSSRWTAAGTTAKGTTKNDGTNYNPAFDDTTKKAVNVQIIWSGTSVIQGVAYYEVFFPREEQTISEGEDGVTISMTGGVYGVIERITGLGVRY